MSTRLKKVAKALGVALPTAAWVALGAWGKHQKDIASGKGRKKRTYRRKRRVIRRKGGSQFLYNETKPAPRFGNMPLPISTKQRMSIMF